MNTKVAQLTPDQLREARYIDSLGGDLDTYVRKVFGWCIKPNQYWSLSLATGALFEQGDRVVRNNKLSKSNEG